MCFVQEQKCHTYTQSHLKAPSKFLVHQWGKKLNIPPEAIDRLNDRLYLRANLGA